MTEKDLIITDDGQKRTIKRGEDFFFGGNNKTGSLFCVSGGTLTFSSTGTDDNPKLIVTGSGIEVKGGRVLTQGGGDLVINEGVWITGGNNISNGCGAIYVGAGSKLIMNGGVISGNQISVDSKHGGAIFVEGEGASMEMNGGVIKENNVRGAMGFSGAVHVAKDCDFKMTGGLISNNYATYHAGAITFVSGNIAYLIGGRIEGNISDAMTNGIYVGDNTVELHVGGDFSCQDGIYLVNADTYLIMDSEMTDEYGVFLSNVGKKSSLTIEGAKILVNAGETDYVAKNYNKFHLSKGELISNGTVVLDSQNVGAAEQAAKASSVKTELAIGYPVVIGSKGFVTLEAALETAADGDIITLRDNIVLSKTVTINKGITITDDGTARRIMRAPDFEFGGSNTTGGLFLVDGSADLDGMVVTFTSTGTDENPNLIISGEGVAGSAGRIITMQAAEVVFNPGVMIAGGNNNTNGCGAVYVGVNALLTMNGGVISDNNVSLAKHGGAIFVEGENAELVINGGIIRDNKTAGNSGAIHLAKTTKFTLTGGLILNNTASGVGGAMAFAGQNTVRISGGTISGNVCGKTGNGIFIAAATGETYLSGDFKCDEDIFLNAAGIVITLDGNLSENQKILIAGSEATSIDKEGTVVLVNAKDGDFVKANASKFFTAKGSFSEKGTVVLN